MSFSDRLKQARKRQGLTQEELGKKSELSTYTIQRYEYGKLNPKKDTVAKLATALNLGYDYTKSGEPYFYTFIDTVPNPEYEDAEKFNQEQYRNAIEKALEDVASSTIGETIKKIRKEKGLTQEELAKQAELSLGAIQGYEQNRYKPKFEQLQKIAVALHCDVRHLMPNEFDIIYTTPFLKDDTLSLATSKSDSKFGIGDIYNLFDDAHKREFLKGISAIYGEEKEIKKVNTLPADELPVISPETIYRLALVNFSEKIKDNLKELNQQGQEKLYNYSCDLLEIPKYRATTAPDQDETAPNELKAAHQRTDIEPTKEDIQNDLDIMNDDSKWE